MAISQLTPLPNPDQIRVLVADSNSMGTQLLVEALGRDEQLEMIESASNPSAILSLIRSEQPQVAVISAKLDERNNAGFELAREIRIQLPNTRLIVLLDNSERSSVIEAFRAGAQGVFCRTEPFPLLSKCIRCVHAGQVWASSKELHFLLEALAKPALLPFQSNGHSLLSARETDVVRCVAEGLTNREIAERLKLTEHTVKNYLFRIFDKLGVSSRVEVVLFALAGGNGSQGEPDSGKRHPQSVRISRNPVLLPVAIRKA